MKIQVLTLSTIVINYFSTCVVEAFQSTADRRAIVPQTPEIKPAFVAAASTQNHEDIQQLSGRRGFIGAATGAILLLSTEVSALDIDGFINKELSTNDNAKQVSDDETKCRYAAPGKERGEACVRAGMSTEGKGRGGVDAYGNINRGDFVRCKTSYPMIDGQYVRTVTCN